MRKNCQVEKCIDLEERRNSPAEGSALSCPVTPPFFFVSHANGGGGGGAVRKEMPPTVAPWVGSPCSAFCMPGEKWAKPGRPAKLCLVEHGSPGPLDTRNLESGEVIWQAKRVRALQCKVWPDSKREPPYLPLHPSTPPPLHPSPLFVQKIVFWRAFQPKHDFPNGQKNHPNRLKQQIISNNVQFI